MTDITDTIQVKSNQITSDDLVGRTLNITVTRVEVNKSSEQPVSIFFENCAKKPFKPCKTVRKVLSALWGPDSAQYVGKSMVLYCDPSVMFGSDAVGGVRVSHMSHIGKDIIKVPLITKKGRKGVVTIQPLIIPIQTQQEVIEERAAASQSAEDKPKAIADTIIASVRNAMTHQELEAITADPKIQDQRKWMRNKRPELADAIDFEISSALEGFELEGVAA